MSWVLFTSLYTPNFDFDPFDTLSVNWPFNRYKNISFTLGYGRNVEIYGTTIENIVIYYDCNIKFVVWESRQLYEKSMCNIF